MNTTGRVVYSVVLVLAADLIWLAIQAVYGSNKGVADGAWNAWSPVLLTPMIVLAVCAALTIVFGWRWRRWRLIPPLVILLNVVPAIALRATTQSISGRPDGTAGYAILLWGAPFFAAAAAVRASHDPGRSWRRFGY